MICQDDAPNGDMAVIVPDPAPPLPPDCRYVVARSGTSPHGKRSAVSLEEATRLADAFLKPRLPPYPDEGEARQSAAGDERSLLVALARDGAIYDLPPPSSGQAAFLKALSTAPGPVPLERYGAKLAAAAASGDLIAYDAAAAELDDFIKAGRPPPPAFHGLKRPKGRQGRKAADHSWRDYVIVLAVLELLARGCTKGCALRAVANAAGNLDPRLPRTYEAVRAAFNKCVPK